MSSGDDSSLMARTSKFGVVGLITVGVSYASLILSVEVLGLSTAVGYVLQAVFAIEINFLLNWQFTWQERSGRNVRDFTNQWLRFHASRLFMVPANQVAFMAMTDLLMVNYLVANTVCIALATVVNFLIADRFVFASARSLRNA